MPNTKRPALNPNLGMLNSSETQTFKTKTTGDMYKKCSRGNKKTVKISKFFPPIDNPNNKTEDSESPYKGCLSEIKTIQLNTSENDVNDFKSPPVSSGKTRKKLLVQLKPPPTEKIKSKKKTVKKVVRTPSLQKTLNACFAGNGDTNPEHLQMALALSESSYLSENPSKENDVSLSHQSSQEKLEVFKKALEQFGFKHNKKPRVQPTLKKEPSVNSSKKYSKKSRYQFITPVLYMRSQEERDSLISTKVSLFLSASDKNRELSRKQASSIRNEDDENSLSSEVLKRFVANESRYFQYNSLSLSELNNTSSDGNIFYVNALKFSQSQSKCGHLLKKWSSISGREISPTREIVSINDIPTDENKMALCDEGSVELSQKSPILNNRSLSPDLFDDDGDNYDWGLHQASTDVKIIENKVEEFISNFDKTEHDFGAICDLTQSSNEEDNFEKLPLSRNEQNENMDISHFHLTHYSDDARKKSENCEENMKYKKHDIPFSEENLVRFHSVSNKTKKKYLGLTDEATLIFDKSTDIYDKQEPSIMIEPSIEPYYSLNSQKSQTPEGHNSLLSQESSSSILISDDELNYSCTHSNYCTTPPSKNTTAINRKSLLRSLVSNDENEIEENFGPSTSNEKVFYDSWDNVLENTKVLNQLDNLNSIIEIPESDEEVQKSIEMSETPQKNVIFKRSDVTPMVNYDQMDTPNIVKELNKFGIKPLKRQRGAKMLKYIYETTHPLVGSQLKSYGNHSDDDEETSRLIKRRKNDGGMLNKTEIVGDIVQDHELENELIFERTQSKRISSCRIPLQIVWYNFLSNNPEIKENILLYEPLHLEDLHSSLKIQGFKFHIQDLLTFLDRKCITIRTSRANDKKN